MAENPKRLQDHHYTLVQLTARGIAQKQIAQEIGKSVRQVRNLQQTPLIQVMIREEQQRMLRPSEEQVQQRLFDALPEAVDILIEQMRHGESAAIRRAAAKTIIDAAGRSVRQFGRPGDEGGSTTMVFGTDDMTQMRELLAETRGAVFDTTATNISMQPTAKD